MTMKRRPFVYAVDFDGTLCDSIYPGLGEPNLVLMKDLIGERELGEKVILWTCRSGKALEDAVEFCRGFGLEFDAVNENLPSVIESFGEDTRKIVADAYIDDLTYSHFTVPFRLGRKQGE